MAVKPDDKTTDSDDRITFQVIEDQMKNAYLDYSMSVIVGRALPDVRDGLKPVHRRILHAMNEMGIKHNTPYKKSARIVGECFPKGTLILADTGIVPIEEIEKGDLVYTQKGKKRVTQLYIMPDKDLLTLKMKNGLQVTATTNQKFKVLNKELKYEWKEAKNLSREDFVVVKADYPDIKECQEIGVYEDKKVVLNENIAYLLGQLISDGHIEKGNKRGFPFRCGFSTSSDSIIQKIGLILREEFGHKATIEVRPEEIISNNGQILLTKEMYHVRINNSAINQLLVSSFSLENAYASTKIIPKQIMCSPKKVIFSFLSGLIDGDGSIHRKKSMIHYGSISEKLVSQLQLLLQHLGIFSNKYESKREKEHTIMGRKIAKMQTFHYLEVHGRYAKTLVDNLELMEDNKSLQAWAMHKKRKTGVSTWDRIPYSSEHVFSELSNKHIGSGWYKDRKGAKFRAGIKYQTGAKIRYSKNLKEKNLGRTQINDLGIFSKLERIGSDLHDFLKDIIDNKVYFLQVESVKPSLPETTYDIEVEDEHEFIANSVVSHNCLGKFHPHGDTAVYEALVRLAQSFSMRYPLVQGQGNFGSQDGDPPAAQRYTEARLAKISQEMLEDIDKETVDFMDNFDGSMQEPTVLPSKFPNLLLNGSTGIAVGMATNIPPHNLKETCSAVIKLIDNPEATNLDLAEEITGPDFPTGGIIAGKKGIMQAYTTGRGKAVVKARIHEETKEKQKRLIVTEIPYMVNKSVLIQQIAENVKEKRIEGISDLRDESDRKGMRIVIELKRDANVEVVKNQLYTYTRLQESFGIIMLGLVKNQPRILTLKEILSEYLGHRKEVVRRRTEYDLRKAEERKHILEGLLVALNDIDRVIALIKKSGSANDAKENLVKKYSLTEVQSQAILEMRLQKLARLEQDKIKEEHKELIERIKRFKEILGSQAEILRIIKDEQKAMIETYGDERKTEIIDVEDEDMDLEELIPREDVVVTMSNTGYVKRMPLDTYKVQRRGGVGVIGAENKEEDFVSNVFIANTHSYLLVFTDKGRVYWLKVYRIPEGTRYGKGKAIVNLIEIQKDERISAVIPVTNFEKGYYLLTATKNGIIKKTDLTAYSNPRRGGIIALTLDEGDEVVSVAMTDGKQQVLLGTRKGMACKFHEEQARPIGRTGRGVRGMTLRGDSVVEMILVDDETKVLTLTSKGYGKKTIASEYRLINRGGVGVRNINLTAKNGRVVSISPVNGEKEIMLMSKQGMVVRTNLHEIPTLGRSTQGVRVIRLKEGDELASSAILITEEETDKEIEKKGK